MPCTSPITAYRSKHVNPKTGKRSLVFNTTEGYQDRQQTIPCGQCIQCRLEHSRQWAIRCVHEASLYDHNCFITLTYRPEDLPKDHSIHKDELQRFFKRLRKHYNDKVIRYYACGEYGELNNRPHYHAILFNHHFEDMQLWTKKNESLLYRSPTLEKIWTAGHSSIGEVTFESAAYVARYCMKKRKGKPDHKDKHGKTNEEHYQLLDKDTGEMHTLTPEFALMSRGQGYAKDHPKYDERYAGGIGKAWYDKYKQDTKKDFITVNKQKVKLPKYYDTLAEREDAEQFELTKDTRRHKAHLMRHDNTPERLEQKRKVKEAQLKLLKRDIEEI